MKLFPPHAIDFYKVGHPFQYPKGTDMIYTNFTPRSFKHLNIPKEWFDDKAVFFGLQGVMQWFLNDFWEEGFFKLPLKEVLAKYKKRMDISLGKDTVTVTHIEDLWRLGYLPIEIRALPEGSKVSAGVPLFTVKSAHKRFAWVVTYLETALISEVWPLITEATVAHQFYKMLKVYQEMTGGPDWFVRYQGHDFSARGMRGIYDAAQTGAGHLLSFDGTDSVSAVDYTEDYYGVTEGPLNSIPASEHSVASLNILMIENEYKKDAEKLGIDISQIDTKKIAEKEFLRRYITEVYPSGLVSYVSDTYDFFTVITDIASDLKTEILARDGKLVFRPDSGNPSDIICGIKIPDFSACEDLEEATFDFENQIQDAIDNGDQEYLLNFPYPKTMEKIFSYKGKYYKQTFNVEVEAEYVACGSYISYIETESYQEVTLTPEQKGAINCLWEIFGGTINEKGYKELDSHVGLIYGDSITFKIGQEILSRLEAMGFASTNVVFGIGSYTKVYVTRDTLGQAYKATAAGYNGETIELYKDPKTGDGVKKSAKGFLKVIKDDNGEFQLIDQVSEEEANTGEMRLVYHNGKLSNMETLGQIRERLYG